VILASMSMDQPQERDDVIGAREHCREDIAYYLSDEHNALDNAGWFNHSPANSTVCKLTS
jgi:hypothetical protein